MKTYITFHYYFIKNIYRKRIKTVKILIWTGKHPILEVISNNTSWQIGDDSHINVWTDHWLFRPVVDLISIPNNIHCLLHAWFHHFNIDSSWSILNNNIFEVLRHEIKNIIPTFDKRSACLVCLCFGDEF